MLHRPEPTKERVEPTIRSIIAIEITHLTRFTLLLLLPQEGVHLKTVLKIIVQNLAVQRSQWLSFLCCYVVCEMEKIICPLRRLKFVLNSIKNVRAPMKPQRVISAARGWEYFAKDYL